MYSKFFFILLLPTAKAKSRRALKRNSFCATVQGLLNVITLARLLLGDVVLRFYSIVKEIFLPNPNSNILKRVES